MIKLSIIIPTYNEAENVPILLAEIFSHLDKNTYSTEIIIVDDNSPDGTGKVAEELKNEFPLHVIHRSGKLGLGSAVRAGFAIAGGDYIGVMDADLSHDPTIIPAMLKALEAYDIVIGSRFEEKSSVEQWVWWRKTTSQVGVWLTRRLTKVKDPLSGFFFLHRSVIQNVELTTCGYKILLEILVKGKYACVKEIPFRFRMRQYSMSKLSRQEYFLFLKQLMEYNWLRWKKRLQAKD